MEIWREDRPHTNTLEGKLKHFIYTDKRKETHSQREREREREREKEEDRLNLLEDEDPENIWNEAPPARGEGERGVRTADGPTQRSLSEKTGGREREG